MTHKFITPFALAALIAAPSVHAEDRSYWFGADLSYVNEMKDCGARYSYQGKTQDAYGIFAQSGHNLVRVRIWVDAKWTPYSDLDDVRITIHEAKKAGMKVLLDFHYSDDWADGGKQLVPAAWANLNDDQQVEALYKYTVDTVDALQADGLMPDMIQVGNETNGEILRPKPEENAPINWTRNARLFNAGIKGVRDASADSALKPTIMLHVAQPEYVEPWFEAATKAGVVGYDIIGLSYYSKWSKMDFSGLAETIRRVHYRFGKEVIVVETGHAFTDQWNDDARNLLGSDSALKAYPVTPDGQAKYMHDIMQLTLDNGGTGVVYWEPAWVSTKCKTRWAQGSDWENAAFFDFKGNALPALEWPKAQYVWPVEVTFSLPDNGQAAQYLTADFTGGVNVAMVKTGNAFTYSAWLKPGTEVIVGTADSEPALETAEALTFAVPKAAKTIVLNRSQPSAN
ncbi:MULTISPECIES: glycosyl hydrolase 53 family protein [Asticcacaulis]|uniref:glycoside hydrolase family 53 protein n=1 Tax=Asticcacaulis TaxID=76890 RepID=UPI001AE91779|nr:MULTISPECIES: glycosyl hydrolase 53 family protein [Asticcacaulis]MBP2161021.1 arabinogalactan endo-1,4-beta-galactosidase [Asticcacaulis solisilvae]MDR6802066.1 arabinogalactan endo-1,4-beta-galactosidase [Asticcacaulis sp. BE141]